MEFLLDYATFAAKFATVVILIAAAIVLIILVAARGRQTSGEELSIRRINDRLRGLSDSVRAATMSEKSFKQLQKTREKWPRPKAMNRGRGCSCCGSTATCVPRQ